MTKKEELIAKLYKGTCSKEELEVLLDLLDQDPSDKHEAVMAKLWQELKEYPELEPPVVSAMMTEMMERVDTQEFGPAQRGSEKTPELKRFRRRQFFRIASAAAVLLMIGLFSWLWLGQEKLVVIHTAFAQQQTITLPDGSNVKLNSNSTLKYPASWQSDKDREVWLDGEAYFEVKKYEATGRKFSVITEDLTVEVLGTVFNVNAREASTTVFLEEGQINLDLEQEEEDILMKPGELLTYSKASSTSTKKQVDKETPTSWKDGTAILTDTPLKDIVQKIHELYEVSVVVEDETHLAREFTIFLPVDDPDMGYQMLEGLGLELSKEEEVWTIK